MKLYIAEVKVDGEYRKSLRLGRSVNETDCVYVELKEIAEDYDSYIRGILGYFTQGLSPDMLSVDRIVPKGHFIMGIFGGQDKCGKRKYAGLVFNSLGLNSTRGTYIIKLHNTTTELEVPAGKLRKYWFNLIYINMIHPFYFGGAYNVLLSSSGKEDLARFLKEIVQINKNKLNSRDKENILILVDEVQQPDTLHELDRGKYYVLYRGKRIFSSVTLEDVPDRAIVKDDVGYLETSSRDVAYYYSAVLNYLAYCSIRAKLGFVRNQYAKPIAAIVRANLTWNETEDIRDEVVELSKLIHVEASNMFNSDKLSNEKRYFERLEKSKDFKKLIKTLDEHIEETIGMDVLINILNNLVAGKGK